MTQLLHTLGHSLEVRSPQDRLLWRYVYGDGKPKPYFHPLCAPGSGLPLTNFEPYDHAWHRGLWFTIKYVNGDNFWEERAPFGVQETVGVPQVRVGDDGGVALETSLNWRHPEGREALHEARRVSFRPLSETAYALDWESTLTPTTETTFDRTPFTTWGGYGGLCLRGARHWRETRFLLPDGETDPLRRGQPSPWCALYGRLDGGPDLSAGVAFFDHPGNPRFPTPFYGHAGDDQKGGPMLNAAFLFHEPMTAPADVPLTFRYRVLVHDGPWPADRLQSAYDDYAQEMMR